MAYLDSLAKTQDSEVKNLRAHLEQIEANHFDKNAEESNEISLNQSFNFNQTHDISKSEDMINVFRKSSLVNNKNDLKLKKDENKQIYHNQMIKHDILSKSLNILDNNSSIDETDHINFQMKLNDSLLNFNTTKFDGTPDQSSLIDKSVLIDEDKVTLSNLFTNSGTPSKPEIVEKISQSASKLLQILELDDDKNRDDAQQDQEIERFVIQNSLENLKDSDFMYTAKFSTTMNNSFVGDDSENKKNNREVQDFRELSEPKRLDNNDSFAKETSQSYITNVTFIGDEVIGGRMQTQESSNGETTRRSCSQVS